MAREIERDRATDQSSAGAAVTDVLGGLVETCRDGEEGFRTAAEAVNDLNLRRLFQSYAQQRAEFAAELSSEIERLGSQPPERGHVVGALHRSWINVKAAVTGKDEGAIISECERGEDFAVSNYREALQQPLPADLRAVVERQFLQIKEAHDHIRSLERAHGRT